MSVCVVMYTMVNLYDNEFLCKILTWEIGVVGLGCKVSLPHTHCSKEVVHAREEGKRMHCAWARK
jgi:hypothetical protein